MGGITIKHFEDAEEIRKFEKGKFELVRVGNVKLGRASYQPGWKWSEHIGPEVGTALCEVEHVGVVVTGRCRVRMRDGSEAELAPGDLFHIAPGHDSWVVGDESYVSLHIAGAEDYAK